MKIFFLLFVGMTTLFSRYIIDPNTYLMWEDSPENKGTLHTWKDAKYYCADLEEGGFDDWWLPSEQELVTIVDTSRPNGRKIAKGFVYYKPRYYWTSSTYAWNAPHAWAISFKHGASVSVEKDQYLFARCVRCSDFKLCLEYFYNR